VRQRPKVMGIGFHKTGTTSLRVALEQLGYTVTGPDWTDNPRIGTEVYGLARRRLEEVDAVQDNPWPILFREIDGWYPDARFVLTIRSTDSWIRSTVNYFGTRTTPMRQWIYGPEAGCPQGHEDVYVRRYEQHNRDVLAYFRDRPGDLLVMDLTRGDGWDKLCAFLGVAVPDTAFPHANAARPSRGARIVRRIRRTFSGT
jgi:hypothetical protein